eukprot:TRINITY_DN27645_c0_g2_i3.p1 TRINITY_DN27645_c0_g2~~TRINITY_DN27645_c0_g2_i3.p1  ORF type:complete len:862 (-),score=69.44 TRINITY_DN27645_c0_g2_i3:116-2701(-)
MAPFPVVLFVLLCSFTACQQYSPQLQQEDSSTVSLVHFPSKVTNSTTAKFIFEVANKQDTVLCQLDKGQAYICNPEIEYVDLSPTPHQLTYVVNGSNVVYEYSWQIDQSLPQIRLWNGPQDDVGKGNGLNISVFVVDESDVSLKCKLNKQEWYECWVPFVFIPFAGIGNHEFTVSAVDSAGNSVQEFWYWQVQGQVNIPRPMIVPRSAPQRDKDLTQIIEIEMPETAPTFDSSQEYVSRYTEMAFCFRINGEEVTQDNWQLFCSLDQGEKVECGCGVRYVNLFPGRHIIQVTGKSINSNTNATTTIGYGERAWWVHPILCQQSSDLSPYIQCQNTKPVPAVGAQLLIAGAQPDDVMINQAILRQEISKVAQLDSWRQIQLLSVDLVAASETKVWLYLLQMNLTKEQQVDLENAFIDSQNISQVLSQFAKIISAIVVNASQLVIPSTSDPPLFSQVLELSNGTLERSYALQSYNNYISPELGTDQEEQSESSEGGLKSWAVILMAFSGLVITLFLMLGGWRFWGSQRKAREADRLMREQMEQSDPNDISSEQLRAILGNQVELISYADIWKATEGFHQKNLLGEGGFGRVYKGIINSNLVAIKRLDKNSLQGDKEFFVEVSTLSRMSHPNLVPIRGACVHGDIRICVMNLCANGSLRDKLDQKKGLQILNWKRRIAILRGAASGLNHLHTSLNAIIVHRDFKSQNVLLDEQWNAKVADFGIVKILRNDSPTYSTMGGIHGTLGYLAPEYRNLGSVTPKIDVFAFGVVVMEMLTGLQPYDSSRGNGKEALSDYFRSHIRISDKSQLQSILDVRIKDVEQDAAETLCEVALRCTEFADNNRPSMSEVLISLQGTCQRHGVRDGT